MASSNMQLTTDASQPTLVADEHSLSALVEQLRSISLVAVAVEIKVTYSRPAVPLKSGSLWYDIRSIQPRVMGLAMLVGARIFTYSVSLRDPSRLVRLSDALAALDCSLVFHDIKRALFAMWSADLDLELKLAHDTRVAEACLTLGLHHPRLQPYATSKNPLEAQNLKNKKDHALSLAGACHAREIPYPHSHSGEEFQEKYQRTSPGRLPRALINLAALDAEFILRLYHTQIGEIGRADLCNHLTDVEFPYAIANARTEWHGVHIANEGLQKLRKASALLVERSALSLKKEGLSDPASHPTVIRFLKEKQLLHQLPENSPLAIESLKTARDFHHILDALYLFRRYSSMKSQEWLSGKLIGADGRMHPQHHQLGADTGRNTCSNPNIVGIGRTHRPIVVAPPGMAIVEFDYRAMDVSILAGESGDSKLIAMVNNGDPYSAIAQELFHDELFVIEKSREQSKNEMRKELRSKAKLLTLSTLYGVGVATLARQIGVTTEQSQRLLDRLKNLIPVATQYLEDLDVQGKMQGYAKIVGGLKRHMPGPWHDSAWVSNALRNTPIQGGATVVFKRAVISIDFEFRGTENKIILPVHDAIVVEIPIENLDDVRKTVPELMKSALKSYYPMLVGHVEINDRATQCWNKDGDNESLDRLLDG